ncbi:MAG: sterol desaturase, partial [Candidatus Marinimicrobia bacterium]|nr:sterol desaturase [Candidatus Neomarinimicrobiota bacterium]
MEYYGQILITVIPIFLILILAEYIYSWYKKDDLMNINDLVSSLSSGLTNVTKDVLGLSIG